jgi:hypothetical protein
LAATRNTITMKSMASHFGHAQRDCRTNFLTLVNDSG